jgi:5-methylcytosine-specific restriction protein A
MTKVLCRCGCFHKKHEHCPKCGPRQSQRTETTAERGYDRAWRLLSETIRKDKPICEDCLLTDRVTPSTECHHKVKIKDAPHLRLDYDNVLSLCSECHRIRTERGE